MISLKATVVDSCLYQLLQKSGEGVVHSVFNTAINFKIENKIITALGSKRDVSPYSLVLYSFSGDFSFAQKGDLITYESGVISGDSFLINTMSASVVDLHLNVKKAVSDYKNRGETAFSLCEKFEYSQESLLTLIPMEFGLESKLKPNIYSSFLQERFSRLASLTKQQNYKEVSKIGKDIAGCGIGLTPSSDDFVIGFVAGCHCLGVNPKLLNILVEGMVGHTNEISLKGLELAGLGYFNQSILQLLELMFFRESMSLPQLEEGLSLVSKYGSTSGLDILSGVIYSCLAL